jgi:hypothetical protein
VQIRFHLSRDAALGEVVGGDELALSDKENVLGHLILALRAQQRRRLRKLDRVGFVLGDDFEDEELGRQALAWERKLPRACYCLFGRDVNDARRQQVAAGVEEFGDFAAHVLLAAIEPGEKQRGEKKRKKRREGMWVRRGGRGRRREGEKEKEKENGRTYRGARLRKSRRR